MTNSLGWTWREATGSVGSVPLTTRSLRPRRFSFLNESDNRPSTAGTPAGAQDRGGRPAHDRLERTRQMRLIGVARLQRDCRGHHPAAEQVDRAACALDLLELLRRHPGSHQDVALNRALRDRSGLAARRVLDELVPQ